VRSNIHLLRKMGAEVVISGPPTLMPVEVERLGVKVALRIEQAVEGCDVIMMLRLQRERMTSGHIPSAREYFKLFGLTTARVRLAHPEVIIMHPGPINRGVEIESAVADGATSVILEQVTNGIAVRMAVLYLLAGGRAAEAKDAAA